MPSTVFFQKVLTIRSQNMRQSVSREIQC